MSITMNYLKSSLYGYYGTGQYYKGINPKSWYTEGMRALMQTAQCYWLYDIIQTEVYDALKKRDEPDTYYFQIVVTEDMHASMTLVDYNGEIVWERKIEFTTFPEGTFDLECGWDGEKVITCLPSEN